MAATRFGAVIFDLFGTWVPNFSRLELEQVLCEMAALLSAPPQDVVRLWLDTFPRRAVGTFRTIGANITHICHTLDVTVDEERVCRAVDLWLALERRALIPRDNAIETLSRVRGAGLKTGLISDCSHPLPTVWSETPLAPLIDVAVFSCDVGVRKPDSRIYHVACNRLGVLAQDCLYVGDGGSRELTGASRVGMRAVLVRDREDERDQPVRYDAERVAWTNGVDPA